MKFIETYLGDLVNVDDITRIFVDRTDILMAGKFSCCHTSKLELKTGCIVDFLELCDVFVLKDGSERKLDVDEIITLHKGSLLYICASTNQVINIEDIEKFAWENLCQKLENLENKDG